jgi:xylose isomerase
MDTFAKGLQVAARIIEDGKLDKFVADRYASYTTGIGKDIVEKKVGFKELEQYCLGLDKVTIGSGRQEMLESILNSYIVE